LENNKYILLTFDLEEFDLPLDYGCSISQEQQMSITNQGLEKVDKLLDKYNIKATFFVTSLFALENPSIIKQLGTRHEIASHSHNHSVFASEDYEKSKKILEAISWVQVNGFRMPRLGEVDFKELKRCGYLYDSSLNPTYIPHRYNNFSKPRTCFIEPVTGLTVLPASVSPVIRFPLFWLSFKNLPFTIYSFLCKHTLRKDGYLHLYFHPWEFADVRSFRIPYYIKRLDGNVLASRLENLIIYLKKHGDFTTISEFLNTRKLNSNGRFGHINE
jgi:peptidoglycan/xylan/chitin deacetylase (PgdA/CDA1 family)